MKKRVRDQEEFIENREEHNFRSVLPLLRDAYRILVLLLNVKALDEKKKVAEEEFMPWDVLEDAIPYLQREEIIFVMGGMGDNRLLNSIELYNTLTHQVELSKDTLRTARCAHSSVIVDGVLYIIWGGGTKRGKMTKPLRSTRPVGDEVEAYDTMFRCWLPSVPDMIDRQSLQALHSVGLNGFVYVMGGCSCKRGGVTTC